MKRPPISNFVPYYYKLITFSPSTATHRNIRFFPTKKAAKPKQLTALSVF